MGATEQLSRWVANVRFEDIPPKGVEVVKRSILDWIGCTLVGSTRPVGKLITEYTREQGGTPQARVIASNVRTTSANAALANGVMSHAEDFDDSGAHPASYLTPTVLAVAEELHLPGRDVVLAWAVGYDVSTRIGAGLHPDRSWHTTAVFGSMGATAAASKLMKLDVEKARVAFGIGGSQASGVMRNFGTMTKPFHPGNAARGGIVAAKLAAKGFTADPDIIEGRQGYADCFGGEKCHVPSMTAFLGEVSYVASRGPVIKAWPCCSGNHQTLTGIMNLLQEHNINAEEIVSVEHYGPGVPGTGALLRTEVKQGLDGKFCLEYNIAAAFVDKKVDLNTFSEERVKRGDLQQFMQRVRRYQDPEAALHSSRTDDGLDLARLRVRLKNGTVHDVKLGPRKTLTGEAVVEKFRDNAAYFLDKDRIAKIIPMVQGLERLADTTELMDLLTTR